MVRDALASPPSTPFASPLISPQLHRRRQCQLASTAREAEGYLELGMHTQALRSLQRRAPLVHSDSRACFLLGESLRELSRFREALFPLRRSATLRPEEMPTWLALGWCYKRTGQLAQAIDALERAVAISPREAILHYNLACYYSLTNQRLQALRCLKRSFDLEPAFITLVEDETDFDGMRRDPAFRMLMCAMR